MNSLILNPLVAAASGNASARRAVGIRPFELWWGALAATLIPVSLIWDYSWESSIGVDEVWSPPHLATRVGVWLCGWLSLQLIVRFSLAQWRGDPSAGIGVGPFSGPSGAWVLGWGAALFEVAVRFDLWWQQAYGLGAGLWHPPQLLKATAFFTLLLGALLLAAVGRQESPRSAVICSIWVGGLLLALCCGVVLLMNNMANAQHTASFAKISCAVYPALLLAVGSAANFRWGVTAVALAYTLVSGVMVWVLPLFPATPLTLPIHNAMTHLLPPPFPLLLIAPALALDLIRARFTKPSGLIRILLFGLGFALVFLPAQWHFAKFLLSPAADNWFFAGAGRHWPFFLKIDDARTMFWGLKQDPLNAGSLFVATMLAIASAALGDQIAKFLRALHR